MVHIHHVTGVITVKPSLQYDLELYKMLYPNDNSIFNFLSIFSLKYDHFKKVLYDMTYKERSDFLVKMVRRFFHGKYVEDYFNDQSKGSIDGYSLYFRDTNNGLNKFVEIIENVINTTVTKDDFILFEFIINHDNENKFKNYPYWSYNESKN